VFLFEGLKMHFISKSICIVAICSPLAALTQGIQAFPLESRRCDSLTDHAAVQECQQRGKAESREWQKKIQERNASMPPRLNGVESKLPINCFKRETTGEQVCAN
jgi:hypothetical protein